MRLLVIPRQCEILRGAEIQLLETADILSSVFSHGIFVLLTQRQASLFPIKSFPNFKIIRNLREVENELIDVVLFDSVVTEEIKRINAKTKIARIATFFEVVDLEADLIISQYSQEFLLGFGFPEFKNILIADPLIHSKFFRIFKQRDEIKKIGFVLGARRSDLRTHHFQKFFEPFLHLYSDLEFKIIGCNLENITSTGDVGFDDIQDYYADLDFVVTTLSGSHILEAAATGCLIGGIQVSDWINRISRRGFKFYDCLNGMDLASVLQDIDLRYSKLNHDLLVEINAENEQKILNAIVNLV